MDYSGTRYDITINTYKSAENEPIYIEGTKTIRGKPLTDNEFTFELYTANSVFV